MQTGNGERASRLDLASNIRVGEIAFRLERYVSRLRIAFVAILYRRLQRA
jgi:hypothetical protein